ncbi:T9SS type A sorting domain-containing protein [Hymenobacter chitinivorans]|uniref:Putative secreted protein (Por secretion system target) n=1 Tax=Hymenobacter chitinivorans DSM 11115 TaxID=1121954 RepID=A0A2M9BMD8_9BACT|nr:T9SS type A sorting domain-containing protein [Hymenobacter chitinivorans]PJJ59113.1 putative secreted protein (Por secretion system target) [Hymenobacter chitinivorans DSM 11115]
MALFTPSIARLRSLPVAAMLLGFSLAAQAQTTTPINITGGAIVYRQDFDIMLPTGTNYPDGWTGLRYARPSTTATTVVNETITPVVLTDASTLSGATYNAGFAQGAANDFDRALGTLGSGSTVPAFGAAFVNKSGAAITRVTMTARNEQWRTGTSATVNEKAVFEYSLDATNLNSGTTATWVAVPSFDITEITTASTTASLQDGNAPENSRFISATLTGINWPNNGNLWIRWRDNDDSGSDALLSIDDFALATGTTTLSTNNKALQNALSVFPNPATNRVTLRMGKEGVGAAVEVFNVLGQRVQQAKATQEDLTLDVSSLKAGVYTIRFTTNGGTATRSFMKQ